jgi:hypothetical protein
MQIEALLLRCMVQNSAASDRELTAGKCVHDVESAQLSAQLYRLLVPPKELDEEVPIDDGPLLLPPPPKKLLPPELPQLEAG